MAKMTGAEFGEHIKNLRGKAREDALLEAVKNDQYPSVFESPSDWIVVPISGTVDGKEHLLEISVAPDFFAVGTDADPFYIGAWPADAQQIANHFDAILPSKKLAREIAKSADVKVSLYDVNPGAPWYQGGTPKDIEASGAMIASNAKRDAKIRAATTSRWKKLVAGHMKDIVLNPGSPTKVAIYGGYGGSVDGWAIQPFSTVHSWDYGPDYSHGIRLIKSQAQLDGESVDLRRLFTDPKLHVLVSDQGPMQAVLQPPTGSSGSSGGAPAGSGGGSIPKGGGILEPGQRASSGQVLTFFVLGAGLVLAALVGRGREDR